MRYERSRYPDKWRVERAARVVRQRLRLGPTDILDLQQLADEIPAHVFLPEDLIPPSLADRARAIEWDGFAFAFPDEDCLVVLLNPGRSARRRSATLLEEFAHHLRGHEPTRLFRDTITGLLRREYDQAQGQEAYDFGSMLLLPKELIQQHVKEMRGTAQQLADRCGCIEYVEMRIKRCKLWARHLANGN